MPQVSPHIPDGNVPQRGIIGFIRMGRDTVGKRRIDRRCANVGAPNSGFWHTSLAFDELIAKAPAFKRDPEITAARLSMI